MGRKLPLSLNLLCHSGIICAYAPSIEILLLGRFLQGLTGSVGVVIAAIARDFASGQELTKLFALLMMVNGLAPVLAPLVGVNYYSLLHGALFLLSSLYSQPFY